MDDPENPNSGPGAYPVPPGTLIDPPELGVSPGPGPWHSTEEDDDGGGGGSSGGGSSGGGGSGNGGSSSDGGSTMPDGYFYIARAGVAIRATRTNEKGADGKVENIRFDFDIDVTEEDLFWNEATRYRVEVQLSTSNGGSYSYRGTTYTMYYGFSASSYDGIRATLNWRSSFLYGDNDPKSCTVRTVVTGTMTVVAHFPQSGYADSESLAQSNILAFKDTGRWKTYSTSGLERHFRVYTVSLKKGVLKGIALRKALEHSPQVAVSPGSVSGTNTGEPGGGSVVTASAGSVTPAHSNDYSGSPASVTGCMPAFFAADFEGDAVASSVAVSGSARWHYDPDESEGRGSIDGEFKVSLKNHSSEL